MDPNENLKSSPNIKNRISPLRTFKSDAENLIKEGISTASIVEAEQRRRQKSGISVAEGQSLSPVYKISIWVSVLLVILGIGLISTYFFKTKNKDTVAVAKVMPKIISVEFEKNISVDGTDRQKLLDLIDNQKIGNFIEARSIAQIHFIKTNPDKSLQDISANDWLKLLGVSAPSPFLRSINDNFLFGLAGFAGNQPFLILKTDSYETAFAGMLVWEKKMSEEIGPIFLLKKKIETPVSTSTKIATSSPEIFVPIWRDFVIKNKDARVVRDNLGKTVMLYAFVNPERIVITTNETVFGEIVNRLQAGSIVR